jgi:hypothetical protein
MQWLIDFENCALYSETKSGFFSGSMWGEYDTFDELKSAVRKALELSEDEETAFRKGAMTPRVRDLMIRDFNKAESNDNLQAHA